MKEIKPYIIEKLHINKSTELIKQDMYINDMIDLISFDRDNNSNKGGEKILEIFNTWLGDYTSKLYCYVDEIDYKYKYNKFKSNHISINAVNSNLLRKAQHLASQTMVYKKGATERQPYRIIKITLAQNDLCVYFSNGWNPVIFEKSKL